MQGSANKRDNEGRGLEACSHPCKEPTLKMRIAPRGPHFTAQEFSSLNAIANCEAR